MLVEGMIIIDETYLFMCGVTRAFLSGQDEGDQLLRVVHMLNRRVGGDECFSGG